MSKAKEKNRGRNVKFSLALLCPCVRFLVSERAQDFCNGKRWSEGKRKHMVLSDC